MSCEVQGEVLEEGVEGGSLLGHAHGAIEKVLCQGWEGLESY